MRKSFFTVDFQSKETKTESSRPGLRSGVSVCQKGCETPRASTPRSGSAVRSLRREAGQAAKRVRSTEDEDSPERATAVRSPRREAGRAAKKGAKHRGRARRAAAAQSEARDAKRGRPQKGCEAPRASTPRSGSAVRSPQPAGEQAVGGLFTFVFPKKINYVLTMAHYGYKLPSI